MGNEAEPFDVLVVGGGVAGLTAAAAAAARGLKTVLVEHLAAGGQIATIDTIRNFPGHPEGIAGYELGPMLQDEAEEKGVAFLFDTVTGIEPGQGGYRVLFDAQAVFSRTVIIAAGSARRALGVPGEKELDGRGVSHCASCDGQFFRGAPVVVVGGGDSAFDEALVLAEHATSVQIVHREPRPHARQEAIDRVAAAGNITVLGEAEVTGVVGDDAVTGIAVTRPDGPGTLDADGVFVYAGLVPNSIFLGGIVDLDADGRIVTDALMHTTREGIFAAGDIRARSDCLLPSVLADGAAAAQSAARYLSTR